MQKQELIAAIASKAILEKEVVSTVLEAAMTEIKEQNKNGVDVTLRGFGTFTIIKRDAKTGRNITAGTKVKIPARMMPKFKHAKEFTDSIKAIPLT